MLSEPEREAGPEASETGGDKRSWHERWQGFVKDLLTSPAVRDHESLRGDTFVYCKNGDEYEAATRERILLHGWVHVPPPESPGAGEELPKAIEPEPTNYEDDPDIEGRCRLLATMM